MKKTTLAWLCTATLAITASSAYSSNTITAPVSYGELVDKITILTIKTERITQPEKLQNIVRELQLLLDIFNEYIGNRNDILQLMSELKIINEALWDVEDLIRIKEHLQDFGNEFVHLARSVYITNDQRCVVKRKIDTLLGSPIVEEKSYVSFPQK